uniref:Ion transport domain-containing protein n=1 Tax=Peronospora matthiolae TaxID=2874970 RepID=A0AAV1UX45_9STRA
MKQRERPSQSYTEHTTLLTTSSSPLPAPWRRQTPMTRHTTVREDIWTVLRYRSSVQHRTGLQLASYVLELSILTLILLNVVVAISEYSAVLTADALESPASGPMPVVNDWTDVFLFVSTVIFSIEYALRLWSCVEDDRYKNGPLVGRLKWMTRPLSLIDLIALVPFYLELSMELNVHHDKGLTLRTLRLLRVVSFLRLERMYNAMKNLRVVFAHKKEEFLVVTYLTAVVVLTSSLLIFFLEHSAKPRVFSSFGVCLWWSVETITSLGYGDVVPVTGMGRFLGASLALWGVVLFTIPGAVLGSGFIEVMLEKQREEEAELYSMVVGKSRSATTSPFFSDNGSDDEHVHKTHPATHDHVVSTAAVHTPEPASSSTSPSLPRNTPAMAQLHQRLEVILTGQHALEVQLQQQQQQLTRLTRLVEAALGTTLLFPAPCSDSRHPAACPAVS